MSNDTPKRRAESRTQLDVSEPELFAQGSDRQMYCSIDPINLNQTRLEQLGDLFQTKAVLVSSVRLVLYFASVVLYFVVVDGNEDSSDKAFCCQERTSGVYTAQLLVTIAITFMDLMYAVSQTLAQVWKCHLPVAHWN